MSPRPGQPMSSSEGLEASRPCPCGTAESWTDKPPAVPGTCSSLGAPLITSSHTQQTLRQTLGAPLGCVQELGKDVGCRAGLGAQCLLVQVHKQGLCCSLGSQSPSGHTPRNFNSVLDIQSTITCRKVPNKDPLPWTTRFSHMEESQMSRAVQALPGCGLTPAKVRTARQGQELCRREEMM